MRHTLSPQVGWGFSDHSFFSADKDLVLTPAQKRAHLFAFWREKVQRPMVLVGASLGGAIALDFAMEHPEVRVQDLLCGERAGASSVRASAAQPPLISLWSNP